MIGLGLPGLWLFLVIVIAVSVLVALGSIWVARRTVFGADSSQHNPALSPILTVDGLVFGALLGFTVVVAWSSSRPPTQMSLMKHRP